MRFIVSPSKTQSIKGYENYQEPMYANLAKQHQTFVKEIGLDMFSKVTKVSKEKLEDTFKEMIEPTTYTEAIYAYTGLVFKQLQHDSYNEIQREFIKSHVYIASAMYGMLRSFDCIAKYRFDYTMRFKDYNLNRINQESIDSFIQESDCIVSLASKEFSAYFENKKNCIIIDFVICKEGKMLRQSTQLKMIRGKFLHEIISQNIDSISSLKKLSVDNFEMNEEMSDMNHYVYIRYE